MDIKEKIEELVKKITENKDLKEQFSKDPVAVIEKLLGVDLPDEQVKKIVEGVKAKINLDKLDLGDVTGILKKFLK